MRTWQQDKKWSDRFIPEIKSIVGPYVISEAPIQEDMKHNTDLMVLRAADLRIACRIRRFSYYTNKAYRGEFTIRSSRPGGATTELKKVMRGWGDLFFYGFSDEYQKQLKAWFIGDLSVFRSWVRGKLDKGIRPGVSMGNPDGVMFRAFRQDEIPGFILADSETVHKVKQPEQLGLFG